MNITTLESGAKAMKNLWLFLAATTLIVFAVIGFILLSRPGQQGMYRTYGKASYSSVGEKIYYEGIGSDEEEIPYSDETVKRAITQGLDPSGKKLNRIMPRWKMTDEDFSELLAYLKEL